MATTPLKKPPLTIKHYTGIGRVAVEWARVETSMIVALEALLKTSRGSAIVTFWHMGFNDRRDRLLALVELQKPDDQLRKELTTMISRLEAAYAIRNIIAHSTWQKGVPTGTIYPLIIKAKGGAIKFTGDGKLKEELFSAERLFQEAERIRRLTEDFRQFAAHHFGADYPERRQTGRKKAAISSRIAISLAADPPL